MPDVAPEQRCVFCGRQMEVVRQGKGFRCPPCGYSIDVPEGETDA